MTKTKEQFLNQVHERCFSAWWVNNEMNHPLVHSKDAMTIFIAGRVEFEKSFIKQKREVSKAQNEKKLIQSRFDKAVKAIKEVQDLRK